MSGGNGSRPGPRVLIIDPFREEGEMYGDFLRMRGFQVDVRLDAADALHAAAQTPPDVVVTRLRQSQPGLDGIAIVKRLKRSALTHHVPVVMIAASVRPSDREAAAAAQCDAYLELPVAPRDLAAELRRLLGLERAK